MGIILAVLEFFGTLFAGGSPFDGPVERPMSFWLVRLLGVALFFGVIAAVWWTCSRMSMIQAIVGT